MKKTIEELTKENTLQQKINELSDYISMQNGIIGELTVNNRLLNNAALRLQGEKEQLEKELKKIDKKDSKTNGKKKSKN